MAEANQNNNTFWQRLTKVMSNPNYQTNPQPNFERELLVSTSKQEIEKKKLEIQQDIYIQKQYGIVTNQLYQNSVYYETTRLGTYMDVEAMEFYPEIAAALDIFAEESTVTGNDGNVLEITSSQPRIKEVLKNLFYNILDINTNLAAWTRNVCKYGDNFVFLRTDRKKGIVGCSQLPNIEIKRVEADTFSDTTNKYVKFVWENKKLEFNSWQIGHFRLFGDDRKLPYGTSILEKARKIWKQLVLAEDAMLIYRLSRAPERKVHYVDVGNIDDKDVDAHVDRVAANFKKVIQPNNSNGQVDMRYNQLAVDTDYFIPVRNGQSQTKIDVLPGASNLDQIADIQYLQNKLFTALRIPKAFLGFEESSGEGKNLAMQDVRFARTINRIQQTMIQELNKIAIIHLFMLGFEDDLNNFTLSLTNPSTQAELLKLEQWSAKIDLYIKSVSDAGNGFAPMSMTMAQKEILGYSDREIILNLEQQRLEKATAIENSEDNIAGKLTSGIFKKLDARYSIGANPDIEPTDVGSEGGSGGGGIPNLSGGGNDFVGGEGEPTTEPEAIGGEGLPTPGETEPTTATPEPPGVTGSVAENTNKTVVTKNNVILSEDFKKMLGQIDDLLKD